MKNIALAIAMTLVATATSAAEKTIWSPSQRVICDQVGRFCADDLGISITDTQVYLGAQAVKTLLTEIDDMGIDNFNHAFFTFSNGVSCDANARLCVNPNTGQIDPVTDGVLFHN